MQRFFFFHIPISAFECMPSVVRQYADWMRKINITGSFSAWTWKMFIHAVDFRFVLFIFHQSQIDWMTFGWTQSMRVCGTERHVSLKNIREMICLHFASSFGCQLSNLVFRFVLRAEVRNPPKRFASNKWWKMDEFFSGSMAFVWHLEHASPNSKIIFSAKRKRKLNRHADSMRGKLDSCESKANALRAPASTQSKCDSWTRKFEKNASKTQRRCVAAARRLLRTTLRPRSYVSCVCVCISCCALTL